MSIESPELGEIRTDTELGNTGNSTRIWTLCTACHQYHWARLSKDNAPHNPCRKCSIIIGHNKLKGRNRTGRTFNNAPPILGEIRYGNEIGYSSIWARYIWSSCELCGKERWTALKIDKPQNSRCQHCAHIGKPSKTKGRTKETNEGCARISAKLKGRTKENDISVAIRAANSIGRPSKKRGRTKDNDASIASAAAKLRGRTKETHLGYAITSMKMKTHNKGNTPSIARRAELQRGRNKYNNLSIASTANKLRGRTKENNAVIAAKAARAIGKPSKLKGRTKENDPAVARISALRKGKPPKNKGMTKENCPSIAAQAAKMRGRTKETHEHVARMAMKLKGRTKETHAYLIKTGEKQRLRVGEKAANWIDGRSFIPYTADFNAITKEYIRKRDNHTCQKCGILESFHVSIKGIKLSIHHIDYNKTHTNDNNLISLCHICNSRVNANREFWSRFFKDKLLINSLVSNTNTVMVI